MSRELWQERLVESVFYFFTEDFKRALLNLVRSQLASDGKIDWPSIAQSLRPFFLIDLDNRWYVENTMLAIYKMKIGNAQLFNESIGKMIADASPDDARFMKRISIIPSTDDEIAVYIKSAREFEEDLDRLSDEKIALEYRKLEEELDRVNRFTRHRDGTERDTFAFFNELRSEARFEYWLQLAGWDAEECIALSLGKDPKSVNFRSLKLEGMGPKFYSPFREKFKDRLEILKRSQLQGILQQLIPPTAFVAWARQCRWELPADLDNELMTTPHPKRPAVGNVASPSQTTLYRMLLGMAITRFEHRTDRNSSATALIENELRSLQELDNTGSNTLGKIEVKNDAIRKALDAAAAHLDASWSESIEWKGVRRSKSEI